ncbi:hypothetical protein GN156_09940 [bacterium LRH843]|nr:hypothetical protein [bacterium LRH843]
MKMSEFRHEQDQAIKLREQMKKLQGKPNGKNESSQTLPPRSSLHKKKTKKFKLKLSFPLIRLLLILFFILIFVAATIPYWLG